MSIWFEKLIKTFENEKIDYLANPNIPKQFYCKEFSDFNSYFFQTLKVSLDQSKKNKIFILHDGVFKKSALNSSENIIDKIIEILSENFIVTVKNLSFECQVNSLDIHASEEYLKKTSELIQNEESCNIFIALGSGTITDLLKHALFISNPNAIFISIPTAMTVTAFTSSFSVVDISGAKRTRPSKLIYATFWIESLLQAAPMQLSRAGYGDLLARFVAYGDWYLGYKLGISEKYDELAFRLMDAYAEPIKQIAKEFGKENLSQSASEISAATLAMAGIAMSLSGETTPLSGYEHVISHGLDFLRLISNRPLVLHGEQVALASLTSAMSFDWIFEIEKFDLKKMRSMSEKDTRQIINHFFNSAPFFGREEEKYLDSERKLFEAQSADTLNSAKEIFIKDYLIKSSKWDISKETFSIFINEWPVIKEYLKKLTIRSNEMQELLELACLPTFPEATTPNTTALEYRWALRFSPFIRSRFCIADFIFWLGEDTCTVGAI
ncbi:iron-containing alcohol dehydrogenase [Fluviispira multicolorata]|uniref:Iron-containing alcohol dehydrogenase n=1 Tax=Fluviispira multicolorata TaxID=2654512 RepID=A0A833N3D9_9BACT|nr:iron-containing alcohol dehydrogenase [Fluviispira multicolorata]KAB8028443.1 iron-containing alcohol dehydrogenase [Fluviispira multicolorata]